MPKISIIVPIYNVEKYLTKCLLSIKNQEIPDFECLMIDDCSPDNCSLICKKFEQDDSRFKYIKRPQNGGLGAARNTGLDNATGDYISFIDSDDSIQPNFYTVLLPYAEKYGWVKSGLHGVDKSGKEIRRYSVAEGLYKKEDKNLKILSADRSYDLSNVCTCIFKHEIIKNLRFDACKYGEDYIFSLELFATFGQVYLKEAYLYEYLIRDDSLSGIKTVNKFQLITFLNSFSELLRRIKHVTYYEKLKAIYTANFEGRAYIKDLCHSGIDYIFPYVDGSDPAWQAAFLEAKGASATDKEVNGINRYRPNDNLKYLFRSIEKNLPWINKIHLVVASKSQIPSWLDTSKVHIVLHEDIIPAELLPTFNSSTIEMFYPNIIGLSDRILYGNDDMFILKHCDETDFFDEYTPRLQMMKVNNTRTDEVWRVTFQNSFKLATGQKTLPGYYMAPEHTIAPYLKATMVEFNKKHYSQIYKSCTKFRAFNNFNIYFYADYLWSQNKIAPSNLKFNYIWTNCSQKDIRSFFDNANIICINDTEIASNKANDNLITKLFEFKFPLKCVYEIGSNRTMATHPQLFKLPSKEAKKASYSYDKQEAKKDIPADGRANTYLYF